MKSLDSFAEIYEWLEDRVAAALAMNMPDVAIKYATQMRAIEQAGLVAVDDEAPDDGKGETIH